MKIMEKMQVILLLTSTHTVHFVRGIQNGLSTATDNIFKDTVRFISSSASPIVNDLSDYDAQYSVINNIAAAGNLAPLKHGTTKVNDETNIQFQHLPKCETWTSVYKDSDINSKFSSYLYTFLNSFEASFPIKYLSIERIKKGWITRGIKKLANMREVCVFTVGTVMTQTQEHFRLSTVRLRIIL
jgi:hypothetical protein